MPLSNSRLFTHRETQNVRQWLYRGGGSTLNRMMTKEKADKDEFENIAETLGCDTSDDALDKAFENLELEAEPEEDQPEK